MRWKFKKDPRGRSFSNSANRPLDDPVPIQVLASLPKDSERSLSRKNNKNPPPFEVLHLGPPKRGATMKRYREVFVGGVSGESNKKTAPLDTGIDDDAPHVFQPVQSSGEP